MSKGIQAFSLKYTIITVALVLLSGQFLFGQGIVESKAAAGIAQQVHPSVPSVPTANSEPAAGSSNTAASSEQQATSAAEGDTATTLHLLVGRSLVITSPARIKRVSVADPAIAEAVVINPTQILVNGKAPGGVSLVLWDERDQSQTFELIVDLDILGLSQKIREVFPNEPVKVEASKDAIVLSGKVSSAPIADKILEVAKTSSPKVVNLMQVPLGLTGEVLLQVRFAEVDRAAISDLGANILSLPGAKNVGLTTTGQFSPPTLQDQGIGPDSGGFALSDLLNVFIFRPDINLAMTIKALQQKNLLQILAEPNLLTSTGKEASFLAGGEFPYPVVQASAGTAPTVTIQFREFGIRLKFAPTLSPEGVIHLKVAPEVSSLDYSNSVTISGFTIPALSTRRVESEMDLRDGQSFAIAGLDDNRVIQTFSKIPGLGDIPLLGKLFQSRALTKSKNELLVVVTPHIVTPNEPGHAPTGPYFPESFLGPAAAQHPDGGQTTNTTNR
jgi:pilus assembly protein CpaC